MPAVVTGASGFIGRRLMARLGGSSYPLTLGSDGWEARIGAAPLAGAVVYHLGARVHRAGDVDEAAFRRDNVDKTVALAQAAVRQGARMFVFASTVKVFGEESAAPFAPAAPYSPRDAYARSKCAAEMALVEACREAVPLAIVRLPLVYGAHAGGNLARLRRLCDSPWPLPFAAVRNRRSWIHVDDVVDLLASCAREPGREPAFLHAAHPSPASTPQVVAALRRALGRAPRLVPFPVGGLEAIAAAVGRGDAMRRLTRSLELDASATWTRYGGMPRIDLERAAADVARATA